ncbi:hypothetical protein Tco_1528038, partial [Tanacetum coccineum]
KASSLEFEKDKLIDQVEAVQDVQVKVLSDRIAELDANLMGMTLHLDEEFYPWYLTTIAGRRRILSRGIKLAIMKCLQSSQYMAAFGGAIGRDINKGMQDGLAAGIDHGEAGRSLAEVAAYNPTAKAEYVDALNALRVDQVVIGVTSLSFSMDIADDRVKRLKANVASWQLLISDALVPIIEPLSTKNLVGEASTSMVPATAVTTALSTTFIQANTVPPVPSIEVPPSPKIFLSRRNWIPHQSIIQLCNLVLMLFLCRSLMWSFCSGCL